MKKGSSNIGWYVSIAGVLFIGSGIVYALIKKKQLKKEKENNESSKVDNFNLLVTKTGVKDVTPQTDKVMLFIDDDKKYSIVFWKTNRFAIQGLDEKDKKYHNMTMGIYSEGGKELLTDGGKRAYSDSVIGNAKKILEQIKR